MVVDPGVGGQRDILYVELANLRLLVPDNGCWTWLMEGGRRRPRVIRVDRETLLAAAGSAPRFTAATSSLPSPPI